MKFNFQKIVIIIAIILLILALAFIATAISNDKKNTQYPPVISECPDYWKHNVERNVCENVHNLGKKTSDGSKIKDFDLNMLNKLTLCDKLSGSKYLNLSWDGITNNPKLINEC